VLRPPRDTRRSRPPRPSISDPAPCRLGRGAPSGDRRARSARAAKLGDAWPCAHCPRARRTELENGNFVATFAEPRIRRATSKIYAPWAVLSRARRPKGRDPGKKLIPKDRLYGRQKVMCGGSLDGETSRIQSTSVVGQRSGAQSTGIRIASGS
jgi:hypothetical protein